MPDASLPVLREFKTWLNPFTGDELPELEERIRALELVSVAGQVERGGAVFDCVQLAYAE